MSETINEEIHTTLHYKDIVLICVAHGRWRKELEDLGKYDIAGEQETRLAHLVDRLGQEMYGYPKTDFTKKDKK